MARRILLVDDEPLIIKGLKYTLEKDGFETESAYDGEQALQKFQEGNFDLILLDVMLPKLDGISVCQKIREHSNVPIIMLTAKGEDMDKILGLEYGADDYMTKPFNILEVKARIKTILRRMYNVENQGIIKVHDMEKYLDDAKVGDKYQFLRTGYFCKDKDSTDSLPVFNRIVGLRDSFSKALKSNNK